MWLKMAKIDQKWIFSMFLKNLIFLMLTKRCCGVWHEFQFVLNPEKRIGFKQTSNLWFPEKAVKTQFFP
jgi:hypothetical protein